MKNIRSLGRRLPIKRKEESLKENCVSSKEVKEEMAEFISSDMQYFEIQGMWREDQGLWEKIVVG